MNKYLIKLYNKRTRSTRYVKCSSEDSAQRKARSFKKNPDYGVTILRVSGGK